MNWSAVATALAEHDERAIFVLDEQGTVRLFNRAAERLLDRGRGDVLGQPWAALIAPDGQGPVGAAVDLALQGLPGRCEVRLASAGRDAVHADLVLQPLAHSTGRHRAVIGIVVASRVSRLLEIEVRAPRFGEVRNPPFTGQHCFEVIAGRASRCERCPLPEQIGENGAGVMILDDGQVMVARVRRTAADRAEAQHELLPAAMAPQLAREQLSSLANRHALSEREREVLDHLVRGRTVEDIGSALGITPRTAKFHQANVLAKLGIDSRVELVKLLIDPPS